VRDARRGSIVSNVPGAGTRHPCQAKMSMSAVAFALSIPIVVVALVPISRFKYNPPWVRVFGILLGASGALGSAVSAFGIVGYARVVLSSVALALAVAALATSSRRRGHNHELGAT
jgi:hypothetical protein